MFDNLVETNPSFQQPFFKYLGGFSADKAPVKLWDVRCNVFSELKQEELGDIYSFIDLILKKLTNSLLIHCHWTPDKVQSRAKVFMSGFSTVRPSFI